jgi:hypothetical protein
MAANAMSKKEQDGGQVSKAYKPDMGHLFETGKDGVLPLLSCYEGCLSIVF